MGNARKNIAKNTYRAGVAACVFALLSPSANPASLGDADVRSFLGQPLDVRIAIRAAPDELINPACLDVRGGDELQPIGRANLRIDETLVSRTLIVRTSGTVERSGFKLDIKVNCGGEAASRLYTLAIPSILQASQAAPSNPIGTESVQAPAAQQAQSAPAAAGNSSLGIVWTTAAGETLRAIARGLYPASVALQDAYIAKMREANPGLAQPADQPLEAGVKVALPDMRTFANESPRYVEQAAAPASVAAPPQVAASPQAAAPRERVAKERPARTSEPVRTSKPATASAPKALVPPAKKTSPPPAPAEPSTPPVAATPPSAPKTTTGGGGFMLRLSGAEMDLSRSRGVTEAARSALRDKQMILDADDQVAALLTLKNTVKDLEMRINEMHVTLAKTAQLVAVPPAALPTTAPLPPQPQPQPAKPVTPAPVIAPPAAVPAIASAPPSIPAPDPKPVASPASSSAVATPPSPPAPKAEPPKPVSTIIAPQPDAQTTRTEKPSPTPSRPETRPLRQPASEPDTPWWAGIWLWIGGGIVLIALFGIFMALRRKPNSLDDSGLLPPGSTSGFSDWASEPPAEEDEAALVGDIKKRRAVRAADLTDSNSEPTVTLPEPAGDLGAPLPRRATAHEAPRNAIPQLPQVIGGPEDDATASLELDTRPATHIDFPLLGDEGAEDKARRLHYMEGRFPELANKSISIEEPDSIIDAARHYFEDGHILQATELLTYAFEEHPGQLRFWLALFEVHRLERKVTEFGTLAVRFKNVHGGTDAWPKVQHIGRDLDPLNPLYSAALGQLGAPEDQEFDPIAENWLNVPMDFTSDALMAELRRGLLGEHGVEPGELKRLSVASYS